MGEKKCGYCGRARAMTREHIIPKWYYDYLPSADDRGFNDRARTKISNHELVVRDVCGVCNSGALSDLDNFGKDLFGRELSEPVFLGEFRKVELDRELLIRWLLKVSYNAARANKSDTEIISQYSRVILGESPVPSELILRVRTIGPSVVAGQDISIARDRSEEATYPSWFRVGVFRMRDFDSIYWSMRHVTINSFSFHLYIPDMRCATALAERESLLQAIENEELRSAEIDGNSFLVPEPQLDALTSYGAHMENFPFTYGLSHSEAIMASLDEKFGLINYWIPRADIDRQDPSEVLAYLDDLISSREVAVGLSERIEFTVSGYDDDPRELWEVPEVVSFLKLLDREWPYWMLFQHPKMKWIKLLAVCLSSPEKIGPGTVKFDPHQYVDCMNRWFLGLNGLSQRFAISLTTNKRVSDNCARILMENPE